MRQKPTILQLLPSFHQGGSERQAVQLARFLRDSGRFRVRVAVLDPEGVLRSEVEGLGVGAIESFPLTSFYDRNMAVQLRRFARFVRAAEINIVHAHDFYTNIFGMAGASLAFTEARVASRRESAVRSPAQRFVERGAYRLADAVVANCEEVRSQLIAEGVPARKTLTIYNGLEMRRVEPTAGVRRDEVLRSFGLPDEEGLMFVTIVANLRLELKDQPTFLRAAARVRERVPQARFVLAGEGELRSSYEKLAADLGLGADVFFTGRCTRVAELLGVSDVCVLSSTSEGFSNSILEYMAAGRPVVATDVGGAREAIVEGETGYLVPAGDDELMARRVAELLLDPAKMRAFGERGRRRVEENFSAEAQLRRAENLYERLLTGRRVPSGAQSVGATAGGRG